MQHDYLFHPVIDLEEVKTYTGLSDNHDLLKFLTPFRQEIPALLLKLHDSIVHRDRQTLKQYAHAAKGAALSVSSKPLSEIFIKLNHSALDMEWTHAERFSIQAIQTFFEIQSFLDRWIDAAGLWPGIDLSAYAILIFSPTALDRTSIGKMLGKHGTSKILKAKNRAEADIICRDNEIDIAILRLDEPDCCELSWIEDVRNRRWSHHGPMPIVCVFETMQPANLQQAIDLHIHSCLSPPVQHEALMRHMLRAIDAISFGAAWTDWKHSIPPKRQTHSHRRELLPLTRLQQPLVHTDGIILFPADTLLNFNTVHQIDDLIQQGILAWAS